MDCETCCRHSCFKVNWNKLANTKLRTIFLSCLPLIHSQMRSRLKTSKNIRMGQLTDVCWLLSNSTRIVMRTRTHMYLTMKQKKEEDYCDRISDGRRERCGKQRCIKIVTKTVHDMRSVDRTTTHRWSVVDDTKWREILKSMANNVYKEVFNTFKSF